MTILLGLVFMTIGVVCGGIVTWLLGNRQQRKLIERLKDLLLDRQHVSLSEEFFLARLLVTKVRKAHFSPDVIFAVSPGGGMIAEWLSRVGLGDSSNPIPVRSVHVHIERSRGGVVAEKAVVKEDLKALTAGLRSDSRVLLVNDISRGGLTLQAVHDFLTQFFPPDNVAAATLFCHTDAHTKPKFYAAMTEKVIRFEWKHSPMS
ncbi:MAG: hypothetical protein MUP80_07540 [Acidobacteriia bacterium]|nr:hypothetical protein [Terriglobia bacterium]